MLDSVYLNKTRHALRNSFGDMFVVRSGWHLKLPQGLQQYLQAQDVSPNILEFVVNKDLVQK